MGVFNMPAKEEFCCRNNQMYFLIQKQKYIKPKNEYKGASWLKPLDFL